MNAPATVLHTTDGKTYKFGPFTVGQVMALVAPGRFEGIAASLPGLHSATHQAAGSDQINVTGLVGLLATPQTPVDPIVQTYAPGSFTLATGQFAIRTCRLKATGAQRVTLQGTARLRMI